MPCGIASGDYMKRSIVFLYLVIFMCLFLSEQLYARTVIIHAVGIDPKNISQNFNEFYSGAEDLVSYCNQAGLKLNDECKVYINLNIPRLKNVSTKIKTAEVKGTPDPDSVLKDIELTLKAAKPGDQIVLSLSNHGAPGLVQPSCIFIGPRETDAICMKDLQQILNKHKKTGVKVFVSAEACMSGAFSELSTGETCTLVTSDRFRFGHPMNLWASVLANKKANRLNNLSSLKAEFLKSDLLLPEGGGFGSQVIKFRLCSKQENSIPLDKRTKVASEARSMMRFINWRLDRLESDGLLCSHVDSYNKNIYNFVINIGLIIDTISKEFSPQVNTLKQYCISKPQNKLCDNVDKYEKLMSTTFKEKLSIVFDDFLKESRLIEEQDKILLLKSKQASDSRQKVLLENERMKLLRKSQGLNANLTAVINKNLGRGPYLELINVLSEINETACLDRRTEGMTDKEYKISRLSLSRFRGDYVPDTDASMQEALKCESSFQFP